MSAYTQEEFDKDVERIGEAIRRGEASIDDLARAEADFAAGVKGYTQKLEQSTKALTTSIMGFGRSMIDGKTGATQYNDALGKGADVIANFSSRFGILGMVIGAVVKAATAYVTEVNKQADALYKGYQDLNQVGAMGAGGIKDVMSTLQDFGYGVEQMGELTALIKENAETLSYFGGTVAQGTKALAGLSSEIVHSDIGRTFMNMGMKIDDINRGAASYVKLQTMMGRNSQEVGDQLTAGTIDYMTQLRTLSRITGDTAEAQQAKIDDAMKTESFNQTMSELQEKAAAGDVAAKNQMDKLNALVQSGMPPEAIKGIVLGLGGDMRATETQKVLRTMPEAFSKIRDITASKQDALDTAVMETRKTLSNAGQLGKMNIYGQTFVEMMSSRKYQAAGLFSEREKAAEASMVATDDATTAVTDYTVSQLQARDSAQALINQGIVPVTKGMAALAKVTAGVAGIANPGAPRIGGGGAGAVSAGTDTYGSGGAVDEALSGGVVTNNVTATAVNNNANVTVAVPAGRPGSPSANLAAQQAATGKASSTTTGTSPESGQVTAATGGVVSGPKTGFAATLHGTEAVVPLPDGKTIPVQMPDTTNIISEQNQILNQQLASITELISVVRNQVSVSNKILQAAR